MDMIIKIIKRLQHNRKILKWVIKKIKLCTKQCIGLRTVAVVLAVSNGDLQNYITPPVAKNTSRCVTLEVAMMFLEVKVGKYS